MYFAAILAGGIGVRMGNTDKPKQYLDLGGKPVIVHTVEKFLVMPEFERVLVLCPDSWIELTKDILRKFFGDDMKLIVLRGGDSRNGTIMNAVKYIEGSYGIDENTVICTHDSVRPFVSYRVIKENLDAMERFDACDTVIPATDTIVVSEGGRTIDAIPDRKLMYQGQTPQTFRVNALKKLHDDLREDELLVLTDACKICVLRGLPVALVDGEASNIKITYPSDLRMATALLDGGRD